MRKLVLIAFGCCLGLGLVATTRAQQDEVRALIEKAIKAHGGEKALLVAEKAVTIKGKGKISIMNMELDFTLESMVQPPDKIKNVIGVDAGGMTVNVVEVINGKKGWASVMGKTMALDEKRLKEAHAMLHVEKVSNLLALRDKSYKVAPLGEGKVEGRAAVGVQVTKKGARDVNLWFDKQSHLLVKSEYRALEPTTLQEVNQEKIMSEYKDMKGVKMPTRLVIKNDGNRFIEMEISEFTPVDRHDDSVFAKPD
ncbi:MAG: hypothetical protein L0Z62_43270 [Gemmataceae bacterium]|nr:hypothetical protein [Gemmataceae bacterium]